VPIDAQLLPIVRWLCTQEASWSVAQAQAGCPSIEPRYVGALVAELHAQGFLESAAT
jgi:hypothetical protein